MYRQYPIREVVQEMKIPYVEVHQRYDEQWHQEVIAMVRKFAVGTQKKVESYRQEYDAAYLQFPVKTPLNLIKLAIVTFDKSLNFGWLKPKFQTIAVKRYENVTETWYNVYPVAVADKHYCVLSEPIKPLVHASNFLESEPCTAREVETEVTKFSSKKVARFLAEVEYSNRNPKRGDLLKAIFNLVE